MEHQLRDEVELEGSARRLSQEEDHLARSTKKVKSRSSGSEGMVELGLLDSDQNLHLSVSRGVGNDQGLGVVEFIDGDSLGIQDVEIDKGDSDRV